MTTTAERAYHSIRRMLLGKQLVPGQRVSQTQIARTLRCSTVPVVEALRRLESEGILNKEPRKMARVRVLLAAEVEGLFLLRQSLEMATGRLCAQRRTDAALAALQDTERRFQIAAKQQDFETSVHLDLEIHLQIVRGAQCPLLERELDRLLLIQRTLSDRFPVTETWDHYAVSHQGIVQAIADKDADLTEFLIRKHIQAGYETTLAITKLKDGDGKLKRRKRRKKAAVAPTDASLSLSPGKSEPIEPTNGS